MPTARNFFLIYIFMVVVAGCSWPIGDRADPAAGELEGTQWQQSPAAQAGEVTPAQEQAAVMEILINVNRGRIAGGNSPLVANSPMMEAAESRAADMAELGYFDHVHPLRGTAEIERLLRPFFPEAQLAELLYLDDCELTELAEFATQAWLADEANRSALLNSDFNLMGAGVELGPEGWYTVLALSE